MGELRPTHTVAMASVQQRRGLGISLRARSPYGAQDRYVWSADSVNFRWRGGLPPRTCLSPTRPVEESRARPEAAAAEGAGGASGFYSSRRRRLKDSLANLADTTPGVHSCRNVMPEWDEALQAYTLPFYQRVVLPSKKNVHIVQPHAPDDIVLLFGKRAKSTDGRITTFSVDYCRPVSCLVAFGTALTSFFGSA